MLKYLLTLLMLLLLAQPCWSYVKGHYRDVKGKVYIYEGESWDTEIIYNGEHNGVHQFMTHQYKPDSSFSVYSCLSDCKTIEYYEIKFKDGVRQVGEVETMLSRYGFLIPTIMDDAIKGYLEVGGEYIYEDNSTDAQAAESESSSPTPLEIKQVTKLGQCLELNADAGMEKALEFCQCWSENYVKNISPYTLEVIESNPDGLASYNKRLVDRCVE